VADDRWLCPARILSPDNSATQGDDGQDDSMQQ